MPETPIAPPGPEGARLNSVMERLQVLSRKPIEMGATVKGKLKKMKSKAGKKPRGVLEDLASGEEAINNAAQETEPDEESDQSLPSKDDVANTNDEMGAGVDGAETQAVEPEPEKPDETNDEPTVQSAESHELGRLEEAESPHQESFPFVDGHVDLEGFYKDEVARYKAEQAHPGQKAWKVIENAAARIESPTSIKEEKQIGPRSMLDKAHRQALLVQARLEGVKDLTRFQELADYFESTVYENYRQRVDVPTGLSDEQKNKVIEDWKVKGWDSESVGIRESYDGKEASLELTKRVPLRLEREHVKFIKGLISTDNNPVELAESLEKMGFFYYESLLRTPDKMRKLGELFTAPHAKEALELAHGISNWRHEWFVGDGSTGNVVEVGPIEFLTQLAQNPDPKAAFSPELVQKMDTLSRALNIKVGVAEIGQLQTIMDNPDYLDFAAYLTKLREGAESYYTENIPTFENITALDEAGLLKPVVELYRLGISLEPSSYDKYSSNKSPSLRKLFNSYESQRSPQEVKQEVLQYLREELAQPEVQTFLGDTQQQEFVGLLTDLWGHTLSPHMLTELDEKFGKDLSRGKEALYVLKLFQNGKSTEVDHSVIGMDTVTSVISNSGLMETFTDAEFPLFLDTLVSKAGYKLNGDDILTLSGGSSRIAAIFNDPIVRQGLVQDSTVEVIKAIGTGIDLDQSEYYIRLGKNPNMVATINTLQDIECKLTESYSSRLPSAESLEAIANDPEALSKLSSPELKNLTTRLVQEFKWEGRSYDARELIALHDDSELQQSLFNPENLEFIKKIRPNGLSLSDIKPILDLDPVRRDLLVQMLNQFSYSPNFNPYSREQQEIMLDKLVQDADLRAKLFSEQTQEVFKKLRKDFGYWQLESSDIEIIANTPSDFPDFIGELKEKYQYSFQHKDLIPLLRLSANPEGFIGILDTLVSHGYSFQTVDIADISRLAPHAERLPLLLSTVNQVLLSEEFASDEVKVAEQYVFEVPDIPFLLELEPVIDNLPATVAALGEVMGYKFNIRDSQQLALVIEGGYTKERLVALKQIHDKYKDEYSGEFDIGKIQNAALIADNEDTIARLESYSYKFNLQHTEHLKSLLESPDKDSIFHVLDILRDNLSFSYNPDFTQYYVKLAQIPGIEEKLSEAGTSVAKEDLLEEVNFKLFVALGADAAHYTEARELFSVGYLRNIGGMSGNSDLIDFFCSKPEGYFYKDGELQKEQVFREFIDELIVTPERCTTYNNLSGLLEELATRKLPPNELSTTYLRIAAAHKKWQSGIDQRTEIEDIERVKTATARLYHENMTAAERLGWTILRRQLPFTANEAIRGEFRELALTIEGLDTLRLGWVHQSVHNYASIKEPEYLRALQVYLETGDQSKLNEYRTFYTQDARAPEYTEQDRQELLQITELPEQLNQLIVLADEFYTIRPEMLRTSIDRLHWVFEEGGDTEFVAQANTLVEALSQLSSDSEVSPRDQKESAWVFLTETNNVRKRLLSHMAGKDGNIKTQLVILDTILDDLFQKTASKYINELQDQKEAATANDNIRSIGILSECIRASHMNGEIDNAVVERAEQFGLAKDPRQIDSLTLHNIRLQLPVVEALIESDWKTFVQTSMDEMTTMLKRVGMTEEEAQAQIAHVDLVDLKKSTMLFAAEPLIKYLKGTLADETEQQTEDRLSEGAERIEYDNPEVNDFINTIRKQKIPDDPEEANQFLTAFASSQESQAEPLARGAIPGYKGDYIQFEKDGASIELYPFDHLGKSMVVILKDGVRIENPKDFIEQNFEIVQALRASLKEGD